MADDGRLSYERYPCKSIWGVFPIVSAAGNSTRFEWRYLNKPENLHGTNGDRDEMDHNQTVQLFFIGCRVFAIRVSDSVGMMHSRYQDQGESCIICAGWIFFFRIVRPLILIISPCSSSFKILLQELLKEPFVNEPTYNIGNNHF